MVKIYNFSVKGAVGMQEEKLVKIGERLDKLMCLDIASRGSIDQLYKSARKLSNDPLTLGMAKILQEKIKPKDKVILATGWIDQPEAAPDYGETDGPGGTVVLARTLRQLFQAECIILTDEQLVPGMKKVAQAAGFHCVDTQQLDESINRNKLMTISILPFPLAHEEAKQKAQELLEALKPACCIAIERGGMNEAGCIHSMVGTDTSKTQAKIDYVFQMAAQKGITTLAIGDGGNEIGMANIRDDIREKIKYGDKCLCDCELGIAPSTKVDFLLASVISNWGCYAVAAMLCALTGQLQYLHTPEHEKRILKNAADNGFHDAMYGGVEYSVDGCALPSHLASVQLMKDIVELAMK